MGYWSCLDVQWLLCRCYCICSLKGAAVVIFVRFKIRGWGLSGDSENGESRESRAQ